MATGDARMSEESFDDEQDNSLSGKPRSPMARRFRGFLPVVVDVECGGFNCATDALLEIAAVTIGMDEQGLLYPQDTLFFRVEPFPGANIEAAALNRKSTRLNSSHVKISYAVF